MVAGFDINPQALAPQAEVPILDVHELLPFLAKNQIRVAILAVPDEATGNIMNVLRRSAVQGVLNFTRAPLRTDVHCLVQSIDIRMEIEKLFSLVHLRRLEKGKPEKK